MKRTKRILILAAVFAVTCTATLALTTYEKKQEEIKNSDEIILELSTDSIQALAWEAEDGSLAFHKNDEEQWIYDDDEDFPVSKEKIIEILSHFETFGVSFIIEHVEDYSQYGLETPTCTIQLTTADTEYTIKLGAFSQMDEQRYVDIGDGNVYLVSDDPADFLETELSAMLLHDTTPAFENVADITFSGDANYTITYTEESANSYSTEDVYFTDLDAHTVPLDTGKISSYLNTISSLDLSEYVTYNATAEELESYGLDEPELSVSIHYSYTDEADSEISDTCTLHISRNPKELAAAEEAAENSADESTASSITKYVRIGDSPIVYLLDDTAYETLAAADYDDLRHDEVFWADFDTVTQIDVTLEEQTHTLTSITEDEDDERIWYYEEEEIAISDFKNALQSLTADSFTDETADQKEEIRLTLYLENENFPHVSIVLYRYDGNSCLAVVDGKSVSLIERSAVMKLVETVQAIVLN